MCGIGGVVAGEGEKVDAEVLRKLSAGIARRGPDGQGEWVSPSESAALVHSRLAIIDLSPAGAQPMRFGSLVITYNGEIYNHAELRKELEGCGRTFRSTCDTEVLLQLFDEFGEAMLPRLRGMFSFAIWNEATGTLFGARDFYGVKPFYYAHGRKLFAFASLVETLASSGVCDRRPDLASAAGFLLTGSIPEPRTQYEEIHSLPAGTAFQLRAGELSIRRWSSPAAILSDAPRQENETTPATVKEAIRQSVTDHLVSDVPVVTFLSAGIDSSAMLTIARQQTATELSALTLSFDEFAGTKDDEAPLAEKTARGLGVPHRTIRLTRRDFESEIEAFLGFMDQPTIDGLNTYLISHAAASEGFKVALSGLGADELLGGYPSFVNLPRIVVATRPFARIPTLARRVRKLGTRFARTPRRRKLLATAAVGGSWPRAYIVQRQLFIEEEIERILSRDVAHAAFSNLSYEQVVRASMTPDPQESFRRVTALESSLYMRNQLLRDADWASMAHAVEVRVPFAERSLLHRLAPFLHGRRSKKRWLIDAAGLSADSEVASRKKTGFVVPVWEWMESQLGINGVRGWAMHVFDRKFPGLRTGSP